MSLASDIKDTLFPVRHEKSRWSEREGRYVRVDNPRRRGGSVSKRKRRRRHSRSKKARRSDRPVSRRGRANRFVKRARRRRNPARKARVTTTTTRTRIVRRSNPRRPIYALIARRKGAGAGAKLLQFTGTKFSDHGKAKVFPSLEELRTWAGRLRREYGTVLQHYDLFSQTRYVK